MLAKACISTIQPLLPTNLYLTVTVAGLHILLYLFNLIPTLLLIKLESNPEPYGAETDFCSFCDHYFKEVAILPPEAK